MRAQTLENLVQFRRPGLHRKALQIPACTKMTWSVVARDKASGHLGVAVATRFLAVGARVPFIASKVGAVATQALVNPYYGIDGLQLLKMGHSPEETLKMLKTNDVGHEHRQVQIIDCCGRVAAHTGMQCLPWSSHSLGSELSIAGNMLAGKRVIDHTFEAYNDNSALPFARRLIAAMQAGEAAGGDIRGKQSAALIIMGDDEWPALDLRVDDHPSPLSELDRLEKVSHEEWVCYRPFVPTRSNPAGITDHDVIDAAVGMAMREV
jgi:uncharacterized Ntn-hydrolase superfamily protein